MNKKNCKQNLTLKVWGGVPRPSGLTTKSPFFKCVFPKVLHINNLEA